jgi:hypothetical protein
VDKNNNSLVWDDSWDEKTLVYPQADCILFKTQPFASFDYRLSTLGRVMYYYPQDKYKCYLLENTSLGHHFLSINTMIQHTADIRTTFFLFLHLAKIEKMLSEKRKKDKETLTKIEKMLSEKRKKDKETLTKIEKKDKETFPYAKSVELDEEEKNDEKYFSFSCYTKIKRKCFRHCYKTSFTVERFDMFYQIITRENVFPQLIDGVQKVGNDFTHYEFLRLMGIKD